MRVARFFAWLFILLALALAGLEVSEFFRTGSYETRSLGRLWFQLDRASLNLAQAAIQRHVTPSLWDPVLVSVLRSPTWAAFAVLGGLGAAILWGTRRRRQSGIR